MNQDIVVLVDVSASVIEYQQQMEDGVRAIVDKFEIAHDKVNFGFVEFGTTAVSALPLTSNEDSIYTYIDHINKSNQLGSTNISDGMRISYDMLMNSKRIMSDKVLIVVSDGEPDNYYLANWFAKKMKEGIPPLKICSIIVRPIQKHHGSRVGFLVSISSEGCYTVTNFDTIVEDINKLNFCF